VQETLIEHTLFADELTDVSLVIGHAKPEAMRGLGVTIEGALTGGVRYLTYLQVGTTALVGTTPLLLAGDAGTDPFGGAIGAAGDREGEAVAEWLDLRVTAPDGTETGTRRTLFDRIGEAARLSGLIDPAMIPAVELVDLSPDHPDEFPPLAAARFLSIAMGPKAWPAPDIPDGQEALAMGIPVQMYHVTRDVTNATLSLDRGVAVHLAAPNVVMHTYEPVRGGDDSVRLVESLDLLHRGFGTQAVSGVPATMPAGVLAGVTSHVAERLRVGAGLPADLARSAPDLSVGALFERAVTDGIGLRVLRGSPPDDLAYPPEATSRLIEALAAGWIAIAPERPVYLDGRERIGWWLVDPASGATQDQMDDGAGSVTAEHSLVIGLLTSSATMLLAMGLCVAGVQVGVAGLTIGASVYDAVLCN
jgi:hypothetical protein